MKKILIGVFCIAILVVGGFSLVKMFSGYTEQLMDTPKKFFQAASEGKFDEAYTYVTEEFQKALSQQQLQTFLEGNGFTNYVSISWDTFNVNNNLAEIKTTIKTKNDKSIATKLKMQFVNNVWKIYTIERLDLPKLGNNDIPGSEQQTRMIKETMHDFALAVNSKDFTALHQKCHQNLSSKYTPEQLAEIFSEFLTQDFDFLTLDELTPVINQAMVANDQSLVLKGYYGMDNKKVHFRFKYYSAEWKLLGITVNIE